MRLRVAQSNSCALLENGADDNTIRAKLDVPPALIATAHQGWLVESCPVSDMPDADLERFISFDIGGFLKLTMGRYSPQAQKEFSNQVMMEFAHIPFSLLEPAIAEARRKISFPERLVPFVFEFVEARMAKLRAEGERLEKLMRIARG